MTPNARIAALGVGCLAAVGGLLIEVSSSAGGGFPLFVLAALILIGTLFDAGYLARRHRVGRGAWQLTAEREIDHQSGQVLDVWFDPVTGERRYLPTGERPD